MGPGKAEEEGTRAQQGHEATFFTKENQTIHALNKQQITLFPPAFFLLFHRREMLVQEREGEKKKAVVSQRKVQNVIHASVQNYTITVTKGSTAGPTGAGLFTARPPTFLFRRVLHKLETTQNRNSQEGKTESRFSLFFFFHLFIKEAV